VDVIGGTVAGVLLGALILLRRVRVRMAAWDLHPGPELPGTAITTPPPKNREYWKSGNDNRHYQYHFREPDYGTGGKN